MPLRRYKCPLCGYERETLKKSIPKCNHNRDEEGELTEMEEVLSAPQAKMLETVDPETGKTRLKDQMKILKERSRNHARDREADELIQLNRANGIERSGFIRKDGKKRTKLDDI